jgi:hypothetical protein
MKDGIGYVALTSPESALSTVEVLRAMRCALISQEEWYVPVSLLGIIGLKLMFFFFRCRLQWEHPGDDGHLGSVSCGVYQVWCSQTNAPLGSGSKLQRSAPCA